MLSCSSLEIQLKVKVSVLLSISSLTEDSQRRVLPSGEGSNLHPTYPRICVFTSWFKARMTEVYSPIFLKLCHSAERKTRLRGPEREKRLSKWECDSWPHNTQPCPGRGQYKYCCCILFMDSSMQKCINNLWGREQSRQRHHITSLKNLFVFPLFTVSMASESCALSTAVKSTWSIVCWNQYGLPTVWARQKLWGWECNHELIYSFSSVHTKLYSGFWILALHVFPKFFRTWELAITSKSVLGNMVLLLSHSC